MTAVSPAMQKLAADFEKRPDRPADYVMSGMAPNAAHLDKLSYHNSARDNHFDWGGYSLHYPRDISGGKAMPDYCAAWDLHWGPADMILVTKRLIASCEDPNDHRLDAVAEIAGTTNGSTVHAYYNNTKTDDPNNTGGWDDGHLTHNHISFDRDKVNDYAALAPIMDVICGVPLQTDILEWIMSLPGAPTGLTYQKLIADIVAGVYAHQMPNGYTNAGTGKLEMARADQFFTHINRVVSDTKVEVDAIKAKVAP